MVGSVLGNRYEVLERIGTGGMSLVYRARDITLNRLVAVKILKHQWAEDEEVVRRFAQEARAAASLVNPHIVQVYDVGQDEPDIHYMVMELVAGETLRAKIDRDAPLPVEEALNIADQVAEGLEVAHQKKFVHRDIKPQNILLSTEGTVKVTDFGIAYAATTGTLVNTGSLLGTVQYLSPEQARGKHVGPQSDLYSLGVVLFEMLTGRLPFESDSAIGVAIKHLQDTPPRIETIRPDIPPAVAALVDRALAKDPADRYQSAQAMRRDIQRILYPQKDMAVEAPVPVTAGETGVSRTAQKPKRPPRPKWLGWALAGVLALLAIGGGWLLFQHWLNPPTVAVPNVQGRSVTTARQMLSQKGLTLVVAGHDPSSVVPKNFVVSETPAPGTAVKAGQPVEVVLSSGPVEVMVPDVRGQDSYSAQQALTTLGLRAKTRRIKSSQPAGQVVRQSPRPGASVPAGSVVTLWVASGPAVSHTVMPNITGLTLSEAASALIGMNVSVGTPTMQWSTEPANTIIDQSPAPFSTLSGSTTVNVTVSNGPSPESASYPKNITVATWTVPASAPPKSVLKVVVTDQAGNEEVSYQQVNPGTKVELPITWYGDNGQLTVYLNGQAEPPVVLTPSGSSSAAPSSSGTSPSPSAGTGNSGGNG